MSKYSLVFLLLVNLSSVFVCEAFYTTPFNSLTPEPYKCFEKPGNCPTSPTKCNLPFPIRHQGSQSCRCDSECLSNNKCCADPCFIHKTCQANTQASKHPNDIALGDIHALKKLQDNETKHIAFQNVVQGQTGNSERSGPTYNIFYNIIKKIYVHNMHVYNGRHEDNSTHNVHPIHEIADIEIKTKDSDPHSEVLVPNSNPTKIPLFDDEDYFTGSGHGSGEGYVKYEEYDIQEGSGYVEDHLRHYFPTRTIKNKTLDGTDRLYFNQLDDEIMYE